MRFSVGQRVRIVKAPRPDRVGLLATVAYVQPDMRRVDGRRGPAYELDIDGLGRFGEYRLPFGAFDDELEPIDDDDSRRVVGWAECPWRPGVTRPETCK